MPYIYSFDDYEIETEDELDPQQIESLVDMVAGKPFRSSELDRQIDRFNSKPPSFNPPRIPNPFERAQERAGYTGQIIPAALRTGGNVLGQVGGGLLGGTLAGVAATPETAGVGTIPAAGAGALWGSRAGGVLGSAIGESGAQLVEQFQGTRGGFDPFSIGLEGAMGAIPGSKAKGAIRRIGTNALSGGLQAATGAGARTVTEQGRLPGLSDLALPFATGATVSGGATGLGIRSQRRGLEAAQERTDLGQEVKLAGQERLRRMTEETRENYARVQSKANVIKSDIYDKADKAVQSASLKAKEKWIENQILIRKKTGKTVKQIRTEAEDLEALNRPATQAVRVAAMRRYARELGLNPDNLDDSIMDKLKFGEVSPGSKFGETDVEGARLFLLELLLLRPEEQCRQQQEYQKFQLFRHLPE